MANDVADPVFASGKSGFLTAYRGALIAALLACVFLVARHYLTGGAWIGRDTDDAMRMVEVRDLLAGQGWFDHFQYRLGLDGGTSMHWSRIVDAPIAGLVIFFSNFVNTAQAEAAAIFLWPLLTVFPLMIAISVAAERFGGEEALLPAYFMAGSFVVLFPRFGPGSIDHHNVQLALAAITAAGILDRRLGSKSFAVAGAAAAIAIAIGVETLPVIAVCCACVALVWAHHGSRARAATTGYCGAFSISMVVLFFTNIGPAEYTKVYCDAFSAGIFAVGLAGSAALWLAAAAMSGKSRLSRYASLVAIAVACAVVAKIVAPQCLEKPYATLDPLLKTMWLDHITEAQSVLNMIRLEPTKVPAFYFTPLVALGFLLWMAWKGQRNLQLFTAIMLISASFAISLYQVRGAFFAVLLATIPLSLMVARARAAIYRPGAVLRDHLMFVFACLVSLPLIWGVLGIGLENLFKDHFKSKGVFSACTSQSDMAELAAQPAGLVASVANLGAQVLLYTDQRVLTAPYHRNQAGMLAGLKISTLPPAEAGKEARKVGATIIAVCPGNSETKLLVDKAPNGLLASLTNGVVPDFLEPVPGTENAALRLYRVKPVS